MSFYHQMENIKALKCKYLSVLVSSIRLVNFECYDLKFSSMKSFSIFKQACNVMPLHNLLENIKMTIDDCLMLNEILINIMQFKYTRLKINIDIKVQIAEIWIN